MIRGDLLARLSDFTTIGCGGKISNLFIANTTEELSAKVKFADQNNLALLVLGEGSNIVPFDGNFDGQVIIDKTCKTMHTLVLDGILPPELAGIPGSLSACAVQNAGAYGYEICQFIDQVEVYDRETNMVKTFKNSDLKYGYRTSYFKKSIGYKNGFSPKDIVLKVTLKDYQSDSIARHQKKITEILTLRDSKGMLSPNLKWGNFTDYDRRSCGSFFTNPIISKEKLIDLQNVFGIEFKNWKVDNSLYKISAAFLMEQCGINKGFTLDNVSQISSKHTLAIRVNTNNGASRSVHNLMKYIQNTVKEMSDIDLHAEPIIMNEV